MKVLYILLIGILLVSLPFVAAKGSMRALRAAVVSQHQKSVAAAPVALPYAVVTKSREGKISSSTALKGRFDTLIKVGSEPGKSTKYEKLNRDYPRPPVLSITKLSGQVTPAFKRR
ncbi:MAG: hypothetical protein AABX52_02995 [Nanoarchaeota archaeon]